MNRAKPSHLLFSLSFLILLTSNGLFGETFTLDTILIEAYQNSNELKILEEELKKADAQVGEALGGAFPVISTSINLSHSFKQFNAFATQDNDIENQRPSVSSMLDSAATGNDKVLASAIDNIPESTPNTAPHLQDNSLSLDLSIRQPLFSQGKVGIGMKIAKTYQATLLCRYQSEKKKIKASVIKAFYSALIGQEYAKIHAEAKRLAQETHRLAKVQFTNGKSTQLDTLSSLIALENAKINEQKAMSELHQLYQILLVKTNIQATPLSISVEGELPAAEFSMTLGEVIERVRNENFELKQMEGNEEIQSQLVRMAKSDFLPVVYAGASVGKIGQFGSISELGENGVLQDDQKVFVGLRWTLFTGLKSVRKVQQAKAAQKKFSYTHEQIKDGLELEARKAYELVTINKERLAATKGVIALSEKKYSISKTAYELGTRTLLEMQNAELELQRARIGYTTTLFAFHSALVDLKLLIGNL